MKLINLGLPKSGTTTLGQALGEAGFTVADWRIRTPDIRGFVGKLMYEGYFTTGDPLSLMPAYDAFTEISVVRDGLNFWPQTDFGLIQAIRAHHPDARFLLTRRDPTALADSMDRWSNLGRRRLPQSSVPGLPEGYGKAHDQKIRWIEGHYAFVDHIFAGSNVYLSVDVTQDGAKDAIETFIERPLPWWGVANAGKTAAE